MTAQTFWMLKLTRLWTTKACLYGSSHDVHALFSYCSTQAMRIARAAKVPYILRPLGLLQKWSLQQSPLRKKLFLSAVERKNINAAAAVHCTSSIEERELKKRFTTAKVINLPLGIEVPKKLANAQQLLDQKLTIDWRQSTLLFMSRLHPKKGLEVTLDALKEIEQQPWQFVVAGDGDSGYVQSIKKQITSLGLNDRCHLVGHVKGDVKQALLQTCDLFILCSHTENFGIAVAEAMANGLAPLVSEEVALASEIKEKQLGYVCKLTSGDLARNIEIALGHPEQRQKFGHNASHYANSKFSWPQIADQLNQVYLKITN